MKVLARDATTVDMLRLRRFRLAQIQTGVCDTEATHIHPSND
jgi:hypothetical protein